MHSAHLVRIYFLKISEPQIIIALVLCSVVLVV